MCCTLTNLKAISSVDRLSKQWQQEMLAGCVDMEVWRADCLSSCSHRWQGVLVLGCHWEAQAREVASSTTEWKGEALARLPREQRWKLKIVADLKEQWQVENIMEETRKIVAKLLSNLSDKERVDGVLACKDLEEWKIILLGKDLEDWKFQMLLSIEDEEKGILIEKSTSQKICQLLVRAEESWRLNALVEAANGGFWLAKLVSKMEEEWQARLLLQGHKDNADKWMLQQIPNITQVSCPVI